MKAKPTARQRRTPRAPRSRPKVRTAIHDWTFRLYVAGQTPRSVTALANLRKLCEENLAGHYHIEVIDLLNEPERGQADQIIALPTLVRRLPEPVRRVIGDLSNPERVRVGIDLQTRVLAS